MPGFRLDCGSVEYIPNRFGTAAEMTSEERFHDGAECQAVFLCCLPAPWQYPGNQRRRKLRSRASALFSQDRGWRTSVFSIRSVRASPRSAGPMARTLLFWPAGEALPAITKELIGSGIAVLV